MGSLTVRSGSRIYVDTPVVIYTVERHPAYEPMLRPLWYAAAHVDAAVVTSDLTLLEAMVVPERKGDLALQDSYEDFLHGPEMNGSRSPKEFSIGRFRSAPTSA